MLVVLPRRAALLVLALGSLSCGGGTSPQGEGGGGAGGQGLCPTPNRVLEDGSCRPPGVQDNGCPAGELGLEDGSCQPAGVPPELCADGFEPLGQGCEPVLPPEPCPPGLMAVPGESACREVAPCGQGRWGDIPIDGSTEHVDAAYAGGSNDGTADRPWTTIGEAITAAAPGALVAIAAGSYVENVDIMGKPVTLWGVCPAAVEVVGSATTWATVDLRTGADGTQIRDLAIRGDAIGLFVSGSLGVVLDRLWVHDNASVGVLVQDQLGAAAVTLSGALLEHNHEHGVYVSGADATIEGTVVRNTLPRASDQTLGRGIHIRHTSETAARANVTVRAALIENNHDLGVFVTGSDATIEGIVVRNTLPRASDQAFGWGIHILHALDMAERASVTLRASLFEDNHQAGVLIVGSDAIIEGTVVRHTIPGASDQTGGRGINVEQFPSTAQRAKVTLHASLLEDNHDLGVFVRGSDATIESTIVRTTLPRVSDQTAGRGIGIQADPHATQRSNVQRSNVALRASLLEDNHDLGVLVLGSDAIIEGTVVRATLPRASDQVRGRGISIQYDPDTAQRANVTVRASLLEDNHDVGMIAVGSDGAIEGTVVRHTLPQASDGLFGDGIVVFTHSEPASAFLSSCLVASNARVGAAVFGAHGSVAATAFDCNDIDLNLESYAGASGTFDDLGDNRCGCGPASAVCKAVSAGLEPPGPVIPGD